jgi:hypothetical protein
VTSVFLLSTQTRLLVCIYICIHLSVPVSRFVMTNVETKTPECIPKRQAPSVSGLPTSTSRRMRSRFLFRNGRPFRLVLNERLFALFLPPTLHYFPLSHPFDLDELKNLDSNMKARWFRMVRVGETNRVFKKISFDPTHVI